MRNSKSSRRKAEQSRARKELLFVLPVVIALTFWAGLRFTEPVTRVAMMSASLALSQGTVETIKNNLQEATTVEAETVPAEEETTQPAPTEAVPAVSAKLSDTPQDILNMMEAEKAKYETGEKAGNVVEKQYGKDNATNVYQNVTVRNTTSSHSIDIKTSLEKKATLQIADKTKPTVLIFHTHTTECYELLNMGWYTKSYLTRINDKSKNMVRVGDAICEQLEKAGIGYIHDTEIHDAKYTGAYDRSRETITKIMAENPTIQVVIDVHRDAIMQSDGTRIKPTAEIDGKKAAQIMIIAGCEDGKVTNFPRWEENLTFALQLQQTAETKYPGLMRPILFSARKYNMDVTPCSVLLEMGSDSNTLEEAVYSGRLIGTALAELLEKYIA